jgi:hypothetical protein
VRLKALGGLDERCRSASYSAAAGPIGTVIAEAEAQNARRLEADRGGQLVNVSLLTFDQIGARLRVMAAREAAKRVNAAANAIASFDDGDGAARTFDLACRGQSGETRAGDRDVLAIQRPTAHRRSIPRW